VNPLSLNPVAVIAGAAACLAIGSGAGWTANGWLLNADIADLKTERATDRADQAQAALADLTVAAHNIRVAADGYTTDVATLGVKLDALRKDFKNAKPLPDNCRPDDFRVRHLGAAVDAANKAAAGQ
jgi:hypothetical protein